MKIALKVLVCAVSIAGLMNSAAYADPPHSNRVCISVRNIESLSYPDDHTILFKMIGGTVKVWRNDLAHQCPGLKFESGIAWNIWGDEVCSNMQVFTVLRRGTPCMLGNFTAVEMRGGKPLPQPPAPPPPAQH
jgi:hypothetical protein